MTKQIKILALCILGSFSAVAGANTLVLHVINQKGKMWQPRTFNNTLTPVFGNNKGQTTLKGASTSLPASQTYTVTNAAPGDQISFFYSTDDGYGCWGYFDSKSFHWYWASAPLDNQCVVNYSNGQATVTLCDPHQGTKGNPSGCSNL